MPSSSPFIPTYCILHTPSGADKDVVDKAGKKPIDVAKDDLIRELLQDGSTNILGVGHLLADAYRGDLAHVILAVEQHQVDVNCKNHKGSTPLLLAATDGHLPVVEFLSTHGALVNVANASGCTALSAAVENGHTEVVEYLMTQHHADVALFPKECSSLIELAINEGHTETAECLVRGL